MTVGHLGTQSPDSSCITTVEGLFPLVCAVGGLGGGREPSTEMSFVRFRLFCVVGGVILDPLAGSWGPPQTPSHNTFFEESQNSGSKRPFTVGD